MKRLLFIILALLLSVAVAVAADIDVDGDSDDKVDTTFLDMAHDIAGVVECDGAGGCTAVDNFTDVDMIEETELDSEAEAETQIGVAIWTADDTAADIEAILGAADYAAVRALLDLEAGTDFYSISASDAAHEAELNNEAGLYSALSDVALFYEPGDTIQTNSGTSLPGTCTVGEMFLDTDADTNGSLYACIATNSWKEMDDDGAAGGGGDLLADGTVPLTANWDVGAYTITGTRFISDIATGTSPFAVTSTTVVTNLNADTVDGESASAFEDADAAIAKTDEAETIAANWVNTANPWAINEGGTGQSAATGWPIGDTAFTDLSTGTAHSNYGDADDDTLDELFAAIDDAFGAIGNTAYDNIGDPDASGSIAMGSYTGTYASATDGWGGILIESEVESPASATSLLTLKSYSSGDADQCYLQIIKDSNGTPANVLTICGDEISLATGTSLTGLDVLDMGAATSVEVPNGTGPTVNATGEIAVDTTSDQLAYFGGSAKKVISPELTECVVVENLAAADDNYEIWMANQAVTVTGVGVHCRGTCTTGADISLEDRSGNAMTHTAPTHSTGTGNTAFQAVTAANTLVAGEGLAFDVDNAVSPETDEYTICFTYEITAD